MPLAIAQFKELITDAGKALEKTITAIIIAERKFKAAEGNKPSEARKRYIADKLVENESQIEFLKAEMVMSVRKTLEDNKTKPEDFAAALEEAVKIDNLRYSTEPKREIRKLEQENTLLRKGVYTGSLPYEY